MKIRHMSKKLDILLSYLPNYKETFNGREISKKIGASPQTALTAINGLIQDGVLTFVKKGKNKNYTLKLGELPANILIHITEHYRAANLLHNAELRIVLEELLAHAKTIILFGSFARGSQKDDSDIDLIIIGADKKEIRRITDRTPRKISIEHSTLKQFTHSIKTKNALAIEILKNHAIYGDADEIINTFIRYYAGKP